MVEPATLARARLDVPVADAKTLWRPRGSGRASRQLMVPQLPRTQCCDFGLVQPWTTRSKVGPMSPSVVQGRPFCGGLEWSKANFGRAGPGPRWDLAWRSANLEKFRLRRSFARGPAPSTPVLEESLDFEARRGKKEGFFYPHFIWSYVVQCWSYVASPTPSQMVQCASKSEMTAL